MDEASDPARMSTARQMAAYDNARKSVGVGYLLWIFTGWLGGHRFYLGQPVTGILLLLLCGAGWVTFGITWVVGGLWLLIDAFRIPGMVRDHNNRLILMMH